MGGSHLAEHMGSGSASPHLEPSLSLPSSPRRTTGGGRRRPTSRSHEHSGSGTGEFGQRGAVRFGQGWHRDPSAVPHSARPGFTHSAVRGRCLYV